MSVTDHTGLSKRNAGDFSKDFESRNATVGLFDCGHGKPLIGGGMGFDCRECRAEHAAKRRERFERATRAREAAETCGECDRRLGSAESVYIRRLFIGPGRYATAPVGGCCAGDPGDYRRPAEACEHCERSVTRAAEVRCVGHVLCSRRCTRAFYNALHNARRKEFNRANRQKTCSVCGEEFPTARSDAKTCSAACKQKKYRQRKKGAA